MPMDFEVFDYLMICKATFWCTVVCFFLSFTNLSQRNSGLSFVMHIFLSLKCSYKQMLPWYGCVRFITVHLYQNQEQFKLISLDWTVTFQETSFWQEQSTHYADEIGIFSTIHNTLRSFYEYLASFVHTVGILVM